MVNINSLHQQSKVSSSTLIEDEDIEQVVGLEANVFFFSNKARLITQSETAAVHIDPISTTSVFYY